MATLRRARIPLCRLREPTALSPVCALPRREALLHAVSSGKGFRMSIRPLQPHTHKPVVEGYEFFDREVWVAEEVEEYQEWE